MGVELEAQIGKEEASNEYVQAIKDQCYILILRAFSPVRRSDWGFALCKEAQLEKKALEVLHRFTDSIIAERKRALGDAQGADEGCGDDELGIKKRKALLDLLLEARKGDGSPLTDQEIGDEVNTFMFAVSFFDPCGSGGVYCCYCFVFFWTGA